QAPITLQCDQFALQPLGQIPLGDYPASPRSLPGARHRQRANIAERTSAVVAESASDVGIKRKREAGEKAAGGGECASRVLFGVTAHLNAATRMRRCRRPASAAASRQSAASTPTRAVSSRPAADLP